MHRKTTPVPLAGVAADLNKTLDAALDLPAEFSLHSILLGQQGIDQAYLGLIEIPDPRRRGYRPAELAEDLSRQPAADPVNVIQGDIDAFVLRQIHACNPCHNLSLPLLVPGVGTEDPKDPAPAYDPALLAHGLHGSAHFHRCRYVIRPFVRS